MEAVYCRMEELSSTHDSMTNEFALWLFNYLRRNGISQADLSRQSGFSTGTISRWISGDRIPDPNSVDRLADALGVDRDLVLAKAGHRPVEEEDSELVREYIAKVRQIDWDYGEGRRGVFESILQTFLDQDRKKREGK